MAITNSARQANLEATVKCPFCGALLPSENDIRNALAPLGSMAARAASQFRMGSLFNPAGLEAFDTMCPSCNAWFSCKITSETLTSGARFTLPPFGARGFTTAQKWGAKARLYFVIEDANEERHYISWSQITSAKPTTSGRVRVTVEIP